MVDGGNPAGAAAFGTSCAALAERFGHLVALSVTDFGNQRSVRRVAGDRPGAVRHVDRAVAHRADVGDPGAAAGRGGFGDRGGAGRMGCARRLLSSVALRDRRIHRLLAVRGGRPVTRSAVRIRRPGGGRAEAVQRTVAGQAAKPADLPDTSVPGRLCADLSTVAAAVAGNARVAGRTRAVRRPEIRHHRGPLCGVTRTQRGHRGDVRRTDDARPGGRGSAPRGPDRRSAHARAGTVVGTLPGCRRTRRRHTRRGRGRVRSGRAVRRRWCARRLREVRAFSRRRRNSMGDRTSRHIAGPRCGRAAV